MPEARLHRVSSQRFLPAFKFIAVALCATAFLLPGAHAAAKKAASAGKKTQAVSETRGGKSAAKTTKAGKNVAQAPSAAAGKRGAKVEKVARASGGKADRSERSVRGGKDVVATIRKKNGKTVVAVQRRSIVRVAEAPPRLSFGQLAGLGHTEDPLDLKSNAALVIDQDTREVLFSKNDHAVLPIASITKLMTGMLVSEAHLPMDELVTITQDDVDTEKGSSSRLRVGTTLARGALAAEAATLRLLSEDTDAFLAPAASRLAAWAAGNMNAVAQRATARKRKAGRNRWLETR